jgi:hypothetical protein
MQEALELVCRRRRLQPKEYALLLSDMSILIPLDRTVASLQGESDLRLVKRSMLPHMNVDVRPIGRSTDPNGASRTHSPSFYFYFFLLKLMALFLSSLVWIASIFKRMSDVPDLDYSTSQDFTAAYKVRSLVSFPTYFLHRWLIRLSNISSSVEIYRLQKDANDCREARTHSRDRRAVRPRAYPLQTWPPGCLVLRSLTLLCALCICVR